MRIADVVKNSIWHDPRVRKQIISYVSHGYDVGGVGVFDDRYNEENVLKLGCKNLINKQKINNGKTIIGKILREIKTNKAIQKSIINYNPDVIHANDLNALIPAFRAYKKLRKRKKVLLIYDSHEIFLENPWINKNKIKKFIWGFYEKFIVTKVDIFICVSNSAKLYFTTKYKIKKLLVITNSVMQSSILSPKKYSDKIDVLNQGQFYVGRGYFEMIDAASKCIDSNISFTLRGFGDLEEQLKSKAKALGLKNFLFATPVKTGQLIEYAAESNIGVAITQKISKNFIYSVSNKLFEYAAAGLPVIMSNIPEHKYLNDIYNFGVIIDKDDGESILKAIKIILENKQTYELFSKNAIKMAYKTCWEVEFDKLLKEIENEN